MGCLFIADLVYGLQDVKLESALLSTFYSLLPLSSVIPFLCAIFTWFLASDNLRKSLSDYTLLLSSTVIGLYMAEFLFQTVLLKNGTPQTEQEFQQLIASAWPRSIPVEKQPGTFRILGLADSFGRMGGQNNYHYLLEDLLSHDDPNVEVVNISRGNYEPQEELAVLKTFGLRYRPDIVLHGLYIGNDLIENDFIHTKHLLMLYRDIGVRPIKGMNRYRPHNFSLFQWCSNYIAILKDQALRKAEIQCKEPSGVYALQNFLGMGGWWLEKCSLRPTAPQDRWHELTAILAELRREVEEAGAQYVVVIHPFWIQSESDALAQGQQACRLVLD